MGRTLHIGCGPNTKNGDVGIDIIPGPSVDVVHDLNVTPWPLAEDEFDAVIAIDVLEHLDDIPAVMAELYRVCRNSAVIRVRVPSSTSPDIAADPTHRRGFSFRSFDYFDPSKMLYGYGYSKICIAVEKFSFVSLRGWDGPRWLVRRPDGWMRRVANTWPAEYESRLAHLWPMRALEFELRVFKPSA